MKAEKVMELKLKNPGSSLHVVCGIIKAGNDFFFHTCTPKTDLQKKKKMRVKHFFFIFLMIAMYALITGKFSKKLNFPIIF